MLSKNVGIRTFRLELDMVDVLKLVDSFAPQQQSLLLDKEIMAHFVRLQRENRDQEKLTRSKSNRVKVNALQTNNILLFC